MVKDLILASRPKTLIAAFSPIVVALAWAYHYTSKLDWALFTGLLAVSFCIQVATNFFNDAIDGEKGRDSKAVRLGPERLSGNDIKFAKLLKKVAVLFLVVAFLIGVFLAYKSSFWILAVGLPALFLAYLYTGTAYSLSENGWADVFVVLYFGVLPVFVGCYVMAGVLSWEASLTGLGVGLACNALLLINNLRDHAEDKASDKKTLVVKKGRAFALRFLSICLLVPYFLLFCMWSTLFFRVSVYTFLSLPFAFLLLYLVCKTPPSKAYNKYLALSSMHLLFYSILVSIGVLSS